MKFPEFIIAGFGRCGTSALLLNLGQHPDIQVSLPNGTETRFWNSPPPHIKANLNKYKDRFYGKISGEKTPGYSLRPYSMQNIQKYIPDTKIILCLRNPVNRAFSHFELHKRFGRVPKYEVYTFDKHKIPINEGIFINYINACILPFIPREQIYFHIMEWAKKDFVKSIGKVHEFLGIEPYKTKVETTTLEKEKSGEQHYMKMFENNSNYYIWSQKTYTKAEEKEKQKIYNFFKPHNKKLFEFLGYEIKEWNNEYGQ